MLNGIAYLHSRGIVHRDLKLENLMLGIPGNITQEVKIVDFGLAKKATESAMRTVCGTPMYVAPEVVNCIPGLMYHEAVDLWSAGVILFMLLSGYPPFHDDNDAVLFEKIRKGRFDYDDEVWGHVSADAKDLIKQLLVVEPRKRLTAVEALQHAWFKSELRGDKALLKAHDRIKGLTGGKFRKTVDAVMAVNRMKHALMVRGRGRRCGRKPAHARFFVPRCAGPSCAVAHPRSLPPFPLCRQFMAMPAMPPNAPGGSITDSRHVGLLEDNFLDETFGTREDAKDAMARSAPHRLPLPPPARRRPSLASNRCGESLCGAAGAGLSLIHRRRPC